MTTITNVAIEQTDSKAVRTKFGEKKTYSFKANGVWYQTGFKFSGLNVGDVVSFDYTEDQYGKQVAVASIAKGATPVLSGGSVPSSALPVGRAPAPSYSSKGVFPIPALDGQRSIVRQNALTNAREAVMQKLGGEAALNLNQLGEAIVRLARYFESYTTGDMDMEEVKSEMAAEAKAPAKAKKAAA